MSAPKFLARVEAGMFDVTLVYDGLDATDSAIEMTALAKSLDGLARILATSAELALYRRYVQHMDAMSLQVRVSGARAGSVEILAMFAFMDQSSFINEAGLETVRQIIQFFFRHFGAKRSNDGDVDDSIEENEAMDVAMRALELADNTSKRTARNNEQLMALTGKILEAARGLHPAALNAAKPIGETCSTVSVQIEGKPVASWDIEDKRAIESKSSTSFQPSQRYRVYLSELDVQTGSAKFAFSPDGHRIKAKIADPVVFERNNPYALAMAGRGELEVLGKIELDEDRIVSMTILDTVKGDSVA
jgi:hypothetical protein